MPRSAALRIFDILEKIAFLERELAGKSFEDFEASLVLRLATERAVEIVSEASRHIPARLKSNMRMFLGEALPVSGMYSGTNMRAFRAKSFGRPSRGMSPFSRSRFCKCVRRKASI